MNKQLKTIINTIVFLGIGIALFYYAMKENDLGQIMDEIRNSRLSYVFLAMFCGILSHMARALRWNLLLEPMNYKASIWGSFHSVIIGYLVNMVVPRLGEVTRPAALSKMENIPFNKLVGTVLVERVIDLIITLLIAMTIVVIQFDVISGLLQELFASQNLNSLWVYGTAAILFIIVVIVLYRLRFMIYKLPIIQKFKSFIEGMIDGVRTIFSLEKKMLFIFYSIFIWAMYFCMPYFMLFALGGTAHLGVSAGLTVLLFGTAAMIIPVPGGIGTFHVMVPEALKLYNISDKVGDTYAVLTHAIQVLVVLAVGIFSVIYYVVKTQKLKKNAVETDS